jgi:hypothetical protein
LAQHAGVKVVIDTGEDLAKLPTVELCGFPISLNVATLRGDKLV